MIVMPQLLSELPTTSVRTLGKEITPSTVAKDPGIYIDHSLPAYMNSYKSIQLNTS